MPTTMLEELVQLHEEGAPIVNGGAIIVDVKSKRYLSGAPYLWTAFGERAFRFTSIAQAQEFINRWNLKECEAK